MNLIVGLGNPGKSYARNRHNIGYRCIDYLSKLHSIQVKKRQCQSDTGIGNIAGVEVLLAKPRTFVNLSGMAVSGLGYKYKISATELVVIYDDLDLPLGKLRLRQGGGSGGHKGIESIISALGSQDFTRIKVGIGRPMTGNGDMVTDEAAIVDYVLSDFSSQEEKLIALAVEKVAEAVQCVITEGVVGAMNKYN